jgi:hypothetical protein
LKVGHLLFIEDGFQVIRRSAGIESWICGKINQKLPKELLASSGSFIESSFGNPTFSFSAPEG